MVNSSKSSLFYCGHGNFLKQKWPIMGGLTIVDPEKTGFRWLPFHYLSVCLEMFFQFQISNAKTTGPAENKRTQQDEDIRTDFKYSNKIKTNTKRKTKQTMKMNKS